MTSPIDRIDDAHVHGLLIPVDPTKPVSLVDLSRDADDSTGALQRLVGGRIDVQAHDEGDFWLNDDGRLIDLAINVRVNHWVLNESTAARQGEVGEFTMVYGDVVMTGPPDAEGDITSVDPRMAEYFQALRVNPNALKDWDVRNVEWTVQDWPDGPALGLGMRRGDHGPNAAGTGDSLRSRAVRMLCRP